MSDDAGQTKNPFISSLEWRAECKKRAYRTVLALIESNITSSQLIESAPTLDPAHYEDVVEERYLGRLCGYPLCDNPVNKISQQKFHISVKDKKVYDLSERKQFCSGWCYKASQYFASQLSTIPLWARQNEIPPTIELLSKDSNDVSKSAENSKPDIRECHEATAGVLSVENITTSLECHHISDTKSDKGKVDHNFDQLNTETMVKTNDKNNTSHTTQLNDKHSDSSDKPNASLRTGCDPHLLVGHQVEANTKVIDDEPKVSVGPKHYGAPVQKLPPRERVMSALLQWKTSETMKFLTSSLPDFSKDDGNDNMSHRNYLPTIDSHNQISLRRRIVTQQLMKGLSPILHHVGLTTLQVSSDIVAIVTTFNLQPTNITFQPSLWTAVTAILLLLIRRVNKDLAGIITVDNMLPFVGKADMSEDDVKKCLEAFES